MTWESICSPVPAEVGAGNNETRGLSTRCDTGIAPARAIDGQSGVCLVLCGIWGDTWDLVCPRGQ